MNVLGIETSCDETAVGVVSGGTAVLSNVVASQHMAHARFGGIVPEVAARQHLALIIPTYEAALREASIGSKNIDAVAVTASHGLIGALIVGVSFAKALAFALDLPLIGIHHVEGHIYANYLANPELRPPFLCLTVSGGHTMLIHVEEYWRYTVLGETRDDSAGEVFDKIARLLGLGFPGGPAIDRLSSAGSPEAFRFPRPLQSAKTYDFSFSGLKTAVKQIVQELERLNRRVPIEDVAASLQEAIAEVLVGKTVRAALDLGLTTIAVTGGVAANSRLRELLNCSAAEHGLRVIIPPKPLCTDNGIMVASAGYHRIMAGFTSGLDLDAMASAPIGEV